jgi:hypothetical protein
MLHDLERYTKKSMFHRATLDPYIRYWLSVNPKQKKYYKLGN